MPWNDNANPGPWGSPPPSGGKGGPDDKQPGQPPRGPRNTPPGRGPGSPPDLEDLQRRLNAWLRGLGGGAGGGGGGTANGMP
ncbi:MAG: protease modulator HflK, partial [Pseudomonadota bacterium]